VLAASGLRASISGNMLDVYRDAVKSGDGKKYSVALAKLEALALSKPVTVAIEAESVPRNAPELADTLDDALAIWREALPDSPFVLAKPGEKPNVTIRFVNRMSDVPGAQGDIRAQREFFWG